MRGILGRERNERLEVHRSFSVESPAALGVVETGPVGEASWARISFVESSGDSLGDAPPDRSAEPDGSLIETSWILRCPKS
jgi:hypothetical protein